MGQGPTFLINGINCAVAYEDLGDGAMVESFPPSGPEAVMMVKCPWAARGQVISGLLGGPQYGGGQITYNLPFSYPYNQYMVCLAIGPIRTIKPSTNFFGYPEFEWAILPAQFGVPTWTPTLAGTFSDDPSHTAFTETTIRGAPEVFVSPIGAYYYLAGTFVGKPVQNSSIGTVLPHAEIIMVRQRMPVLPLSSLMYYEGSSNLNPITIADRTFPKGSLVYMSWGMEPRADPATGIRCWDITLNFLANYQLDFNSVMDPSGAYVVVNTQAGGGGYYPFPYQDFSILMGNSFTL